MFSGKEFQVLKPALANALSPNVLSRALGTVYKSLLLILRQPVGLYRKIGNCSGGLIHYKAQQLIYDPVLYRKPIQCMSVILVQYDRSTSRQGIQQCFESAEVGQFQTLEVSSNTPTLLFKTDA